jgi:hypothetical protein
MTGTARRLAALIGGAVLLVLALAAGPAAAMTGAMMAQGGRGTGFVTITTTPPGGSRALIAVLSAVAIALVAGVALAVERRSRLSVAAVEGPAEEAQDAGDACDDVVCEWHPPVPETEKRKAA